jgi:hypothetical protein
MTTFLNANLPSEDEEDESFDPDKEAQPSGAANKRARQTTGRCDKA